MAAPTAAEIMMQATRVPATQATSIEQSRAVAEVQAAIIVAQQRPRDEARALLKAVESCQSWEVAEAAFWKFPRAGETLTGETIQLAVELARCWGNNHYGIMELSRDDAGGVSEMLAFAWDLETNTQSRMTFQVPHIRDTRNGPKKITDMRDIYENNANQGARRLRECIFRILPPFLKERAKAECYKTLESGKGKAPMPERIASAIDGFGRIGISRERLEAKVGPLDKLLPADIANLEVSFRSITRKEISADEEFPKVGHVEAAKDIRKAVDSKKAEPEQGRSDEQHGDQHDGNAQAIADDLISRANRAEIIGDIINLRSEMEKAAADLTDDDYDRVRDAITKSETRIKGGAR